LKRSKPEKIFVFLPTGITEKRTLQTSRAVPLQMKTSKNRKIPLFKTYRSLGPPTRKSRYTVIIKHFWLYLKCKVRNNHKGALDVYNLIRSQLPLSKSKSTGKTDFTMTQILMLCYDKLVICRFDLIYELKILKYSPIFMKWRTRNTVRMVCKSFE